MFLEIIIFGLIVFLVLLFIRTNVIINKEYKEYLASNHFQPLDKNEIRFNGGEKCDMKVGPCNCGSWHDNDNYEPGKGYV